MTTDSAELESLSRDLAKRLLERGWMLITAESCTGGWLAKQITDLAGSSAWFERGLVTYSNTAKQDLLGVRASTLAAHGAVSGATAEEMACGALDRSPAHISVAVTGIAGPDGGSAEKPVGTVWFAWRVRDGTMRTQSILFSGDRASVRAQAVTFALQGLIDVLDRV